MILEPYLLYTLADRLSCEECTVMIVYMVSLGPDVIEVPFSVSLELN